MCYTEQHQPLRDWTGYVYKEQKGNKERKFLRHIFGKLNFFSNLDIFLVKLFCDFCQLILSSFLRWDRVFLRRCDPSLPKSLAIIFLDNLRGESAKSDSFLSHIRSSTNQVITWHFSEHFFKGWNFLWSLAPTYSFSCLTLFFF